MNQIDIRQNNFTTFTSVSSDKIQAFHASQPHRYLIPVGGGKDSGLTIGLLEAHEYEFASMLLNPQQAAKDVVSTTKSPVITVERSIDSQLFELHNQGHPNGHTPFSAYLAFLSVFVAAVFGYDTVLLSNERSAEEATVTYLDQPVNHQYTKTFAFESLFRRYLQQYISTKISYLSLLRPFYELQIAKKFSEYQKFHPLIKSCNRGSRQNSWCGICPKCVSTYIVLFPFLEETTKAMFGKDIYADERLFERVQELIDPTKVRPFECVGTREESIIGLYMAIEVYQSQHKDLPPLLKQIETMYLEKEERLSERKEALLSSFGTDHFLSKELLSLIR